MEAIVRLKDKVIGLVSKTRLDDELFRLKVGETLQYESRPVGSVRAVHHLTRLDKTTLNHVIEFIQPDGSSAKFPQTVIRL